MSQPLDSNFIPENSRGRVLFVRWPLSSIKQIRTANRHGDNPEDSFGEQWETGKTYSFDQYLEGTDYYPTSCMIEDEAGVWHGVNLEEGYFIIQEHWL